MTIPRWWHWLLYYPIVNLQTCCYSIGYQTFFLIGQTMTPIAPVIWPGRPSQLPDLTMWMTPSPHGDTDVTSDAAVPRLPRPAVVSLPQDLLLITPLVPHITLLRFVDDLLLIADIGVQLVVDLTSQLLLLPCLLFSIQAVWWTTLVVLIVIPLTFGRYWLIIVVVVLLTPEPPSPVRTTDFPDYWPWPGDQAGCYCGVGHATV